MGDVVHATAVVNDILRVHPQAHIDWLVEPAFAAIPAMHPGVRQVHLLAWRRWRKALGSRATWTALQALRLQLKQARYDLVLDLQGLLKSALWARQTGSPVAGYDQASAREPLAAWFYSRRAAVPRSWQAVQRCRALAAAHLGFALPDTAPDFGLIAPAPVWTVPGTGPGDAPSLEPQLKTAMQERFVVLIPNASRPEKHWPEADWIAVGQDLLQRHCVPVVLWGSPSEQAMAQRIAAGCAARVPPFLKVGEMAAVLAGAQQVVGLDTGFTHLAAALGRPTVGIYCDHEPGLAGITGAGPVSSIGGKGQVPTREAVLALVRRQQFES